jgi:hypothetical protein
MSLLLRLVGADEPAAVTSGYGGQARKHTDVYARRRLWREEERLANQITRAIAEVKVDPLPAEIDKLERLRADLAVIRLEMAVAGIVQRRAYVEQAAERALVAARIAAEQVEADRIAFEADEEDALEALLWAV